MTGIDGSVRHSRRALECETRKGARDFGGRTLLPALVALSPRPLLFTPKPPCSIRIPLQHRWLAYLHYLYPTTVHVDDGGVHRVNERSRRPNRLQKSYAESISRKRGSVMILSAMVLSCAILVSRNPQGPHSPHRRVLSRHSVSIFDHLDHFHDAHEQACVDAVNCKQHKQGRAHREKSPDFANL